MIMLKCMRVRLGKLVACTRKINELKRMMQEEDLNDVCNPRDFIKYCRLRCPLNTSRTHAGRQLMTRQHTIL